MTNLTASFKCLNSCAGKEQDLQWKLLVTLEKTNENNLYEVIKRTAIDVKSAEKPKAERKREEGKMV